jgi:hypothetical protein
MNWKIKEFNEPGSDNASAANVFLKEIMSRVISVTPLVNPILGGIGYIVVYWA